MSKYATDRFHRLPVEKKEAVINAIISEFGEFGFGGANTNRIAQAAGVSVGALFKYFVSKDDMFRFIVESGAEKIESSVRELVDAEAPTIFKIEQLFRTSIEESRANRQWVRLYHEVSTIGNRQIAADVAKEMEAYTSEGYAKIIAQGQEAGDVRTDIPAELIAFIIDSLLITCQFTATTHYYQDRLTMYAGDVDDETLVATMTSFVTRAIGA